MLFYLGTYANPKTQGIHLYSLDEASGKVEHRALAAATRCSAFLAIHPSGRFVYAVDEGSSFDGRPTGSVLAFAVDPATAALTLLNQQSSEGQWPLHVSLDAAGRYALAANYRNGVVCLLPIGADGQLAPATSVLQHEGRGAHPSRQDAPHPHSAYFDPTGQFVLAADLGIDKLMLYRLDAASGQLQPHDPCCVQTAPGSGPRHMTFHPTLPVAYLLNELDGTLVAMTYDAARGSLKTLQTIKTLPEGFSEYNLTAEIVVHPSGRFVYATNRGHDSLVIYAVDGQTGALTLIGHESTRGKHPRNFTIDPSGRWLIVANKDSDSLAVFRVDQATGKLQVVDEFANPAPACIRFLPQGVAQ